MFYFNPLDDRCKNVVGAVKEGENLKLTVFTDLESVTLYVVADDSGMERAYPMEKTSGGFFVYVDLPVGLYWYRFESGNTRFSRGLRMSAEANSYSNYQLTVYSSEKATSNLLSGGIIYQIFPDRFALKGDFEVGKGKIKRTDWGGTPTYRDSDGEVKNNEFFGGNFKGITEKLKYLKDLGVTVVYLNPITKAYSSHRYDTGNYLEVDPVLGTEEDLKQMLDEGKKLGISFVFDGVYNHTGSDSLYFNRAGNYEGKGAYNSKKSRYYQWYTFTEYPNEYLGWWDFKTLPAIKKDSESFQSFVCKKVLPKYFGMGFKGVRLDVVDELSDQFVAKINDVARSFSPDNAVIGEVWEDASNKIAYGVRRKYFQGGELDSVMNYPLRDAIINYLLTCNTEKILNVFDEQVNNFSKDVLLNLMNVLSTHDTPRIITILGRTKVVLDKDLLKYESLDDELYERGKTLAKLAYAIAFTCYGSPSVYYGDEAGMTGDLDPYNRRCYPWGKEDADMMAYIKRLSDIRTSSAAIRKGTFKVIYSDTQILAYTREYENERVLVAISKYASDVTLALSEDFAVYGDDEYKNTFTLPSDGALILKAKN